MILYAILRNCSEVAYIAPLKLCLIFVSVYSRFFVYLCNEMEGKL